jgi:predicted TIM-barrel fold metal-dependent hydrolase
MRSVRRREFLAALLAPAAPAAFAIDSHVHFYDPARPQGVPWPPAEDRLLYRTVMPAELRNLARPCGVAGVIVIEASPWLEDNQWLLDLAAREPFILAVVGRLDPADPGFPGHLRRFAANPLFRGLRLGHAALSSPQISSALRLLDRLGLSLDLLGGAAMLDGAERLARQFPRLRIIIDHMPFDEPLPRDLRLRLRARRNLYCKISHLPRRRDEETILDPAFYRPLLDPLLETFGETRVVFGSNWPVSDRVAPYGAAFEILVPYFRSLGDPAFARFFYRNAESFYRPPRRAQPSVSITA